jgi:hypothetical protein
MPKLHGIAAMRKAKDLPGGQNSRFWMSATSRTVIVRSSTERRISCTMISASVTDAGAQEVELPSEAIIAGQLCRWPRPRLACWSRLLSESGVLRGAEPGRGA